jgi:hypothetical protein
MRYDHIHNVKEMRRLERNKWKVTCRCDWMVTAPDPVEARSLHSYHVVVEHDKDCYGPLT